MRQNISHLDAHGKLQVMDHVAHRSGILTQVHRCCRRFIQLEPLCLQSWPVIHKDSIKRESI